MTEADEQRQLSLQSQAETSVSSSQAEASGFLLDTGSPFFEQGEGREMLHRASTWPTSIEMTEIARAGMRLNLLSQVGIKTFAWANTWRGPLT